MTQKNLFASFLTWLKNHYRPLLVATVIGLSLLARLWKGEYIPFIYDGDEVAHILAGESLFDYGIPISWSSFENKATRWEAFELGRNSMNQVQYLTMIRPWLDHPFVLPMLIGGWVELWGYHFPQIPPTLLYRLPMIAISGVTLWLIYKICRRLFNYESALVALTVVGFSPVLIFAQRMVVGENLLCALILLAMYLYIERKPLWTIVLVTIMAGLVKITGLMILPVIVIGLIADKQYRSAIIYGAASLLGTAALFGLYGYLVGGQAFFTALQHQSFRLVGWSNLAFIVSHPGFHTMPLLDFSYYLILIGGLCIFSLPDTQRGTKLISWLIMIALVTIWATSAEQDMLGWYKLPLFCVLGVATGAVVYARKYQLLILLLALTVINNLGLVRYPQHPLPETNVLRAVLGSGLLAGLGLLYGKLKIRRYQAIMVVLLVMYAAQGLYVADSYFAGLCRDRNCPTPETTLVGIVKSKLHSLRNL